MASQSGNKRSNQASLPWLRVPVTVEAAGGMPLQEVAGMHADLVKAMKQGGSSLSHDLCISASTGSGKTLAYALPMLQALHGESGSGLRALVVLPTQSLAAQVYEVIAGLCPVLGLRIALAGSRSSFAAEAAAFGRAVPADAAGLLHAAWTSGTQLGTQTDVTGSDLDILVATPGRLMQHLRHTPGLHLDGLRFLVADEADRLLRQAYHHWLPTVMAATSRAAEQPGRRRVVKIVVTASMTQDPSKLDQLQLDCPRCITMGTQGRPKLPKELQEFKLLCTAGKKPLCLLQVLAAVHGRPVLVFTASVDVAHRLAVFLKHALLSSHPDSVLEFSSQIPADVRAKNLQAFRSGRAPILVASDAMTRGIDVPLVGTVVNYDAPARSTTYLHRAGRTARAGQPGTVITLLRSQDMRHFKAMLRKLDNAYVKDWQWDKGALAQWEAACAAGLAAVQGDLLDA